MPKDVLSHPNDMSNGENEVAVKNLFNMLIFFFLLLLK